MTTRRAFLAAAVAAPVAAAFAASALRAQTASPAPACFDPAALPARDRNMRRAVSFQAVSPDPKKHCSLCTFFKPVGSDCGSCQLLNGGVVNAISVCDSWAPKA